MLQQLGDPVELPLQEVRTLLEHAVARVDNQEAVEDRV
jgi:hypothetical protein